MGVDRQDYRQFAPRAAAEETAQLHLVNCISLSGEALAERILRELPLAEDALHLRTPWCELLACTLKRKNVQVIRPPVLTRLRNCDTLNLMQVPWLRYLRCPIGTPVKLYCTGRAGKI